jgi:putative ABC transport system permease protein
MLWKESIRLAFDTLRSHKLRSFLTLLGVIISVCTLIAVVSVIDGMDLYIADHMANLGSNVFVVTRFGIINNLKDWVDAQKRKRLFIEDMEWMHDTLRLAKAVGGTSGHVADVKYGNQSLQDVNIRGVTANMINIGTEQVETGRYVTESDYKRRAYVAFIGFDIADKLFPGLEPLGKTIFFRGQSFEVVGVAKAIGSAFGQSQDNFVIIPLTTFFKLFDDNRFQSVSIQVQAVNAALMQDSQDEARLLLRARRHVKWDAKDDFGIISSDAIMTLFHDLTGVIAMVAVGVTSIFLVVGGIVIMNIMLAAVSERTHEIGIRKSLGARRRDILLQFLVEAAMLSTAGGLLGVFVAWVGTKIMTATTPIPSSLPWSAVITAVLVSAAVGLFFGIYPANKAAQLDPIAALRAD